MIYEFRNIKNESHSQGYATVNIFNNQANIDPMNKAQVALAEKLGGKPHTSSVQKKQQVTKKRGDK